MSTSIRATVFAVATLALVAAASHAFAEDAQSTTRIVTYRDLNLTTASGTTTLQHRIQVAARRACGPAELLGSPDFDSYTSCVNAAVTRAHRQVAL